MDSLGRIATKEKGDPVNRLLCSCAGARQRAKGAASQRHRFRKGEVEGRPPNRPPAWMESEPEHWIYPRSGAVASSLTDGPGIWKARIGDLKDKQVEGRGLWMNLSEGGEV